MPGNTNAMVGVTYSQSVGYVDTMAFNGAGNLIVMDRGASQQVKLFTQAQLNQHSTSVTNGSGTVITLPQPSWWAVNHFDINNPLLVRGTSMIFK